MLLSACFSRNNLSLLPTDDGSLYTVVVSPAGGKTDDKILIVDVDGVITEWGESRFFSHREPTTFQVRQKLERALQDPDIKAVIVRINSPGGGTNASDVVYQEIMDYKAQAKVPVVAMQMGVAASGGYYLSCAADKIVAHPATITGSIGVIALSFGFDGLFEKIGMEARIVKSGELKDMGNPFNEWTAPEKEAMQKIVDEMFARFLGIVKKSRSLDDAQVEAISDGRVFTAAEAKRLKLVDRIGYIDDAIDEALKLARIKDADVIMYTPSEKENRNVYTQSSAADMKLPSTFSLGNVSAEALLEFARPKLMYMWMGE
jgi:protease-4